MKRYHSVILMFVLFCALAAAAGCKRGAKSAAIGEVHTDSIQPGEVALLDHSVNENSGIIFWNEMLWTFNDSGGKNELYAVDTLSGRVLKTVLIKNAENTDWEDITQDQEYIYIAETGNNAGTRSDLKILKIRKDEISKDVESTVEAGVIAFEYADRVDFNPPYRLHPFDCEALVAWGDSLYVFTKDWKDFKTKVYGFPKIPGEYMSEVIDSFEIGALVTGADISSDSTLALVGYYDYQSYVWSFDISGKHFFTNARKQKLSGLYNAQTEGICYSPGGKLLISCEKTENFKQQLWRIDTF
ncbi:hypothetical protein [Roseimarinus sediminis]|uniref:hypothetical protein n=1 Tax=Roseimarinus sediminis TaxID=1610899 RepID=UPI003D23C4F6